MDFLFQAVILQSAHIFGKTLIYTAHHALFTVHTARPLYRTARPLYHTIRFIYHTIRILYHTTRLLCRTARPLYRTARPLYRIARTFSECIFAECKLGFTQLQYVPRVVLLGFWSLIDLERKQAAVDDAQLEAASVDALDPFERALVPLGTCSTERRIVYTYLLNSKDKSYKQRHAAAMRL